MQLVSITADVQLFAAVALVTCLQLDIKHLVCVIIVGRNKRHR